jgi:alpha-tubulin suppressor-like RCC1 family protein
VAGGIAFTAVSAGVAHTCGITSSGSAYCWGSNANGQLGIGSIGGSTTTPQLVAGGHSFIGITAGDHHTCGQLASGRLASGPAYCWGRNDHGQLGDGTRTDRGVPAPMGDYRPTS